MSIIQSLMTYSNSPAKYVTVSPSISWQAVSSSPKEELLSMISTCSSSKLSGSSPYSKISLRGIMSESYYQIVELRQARGWGGCCYRSLAWWAWSLRNQPAWKSYWSCSAMVWPGTSNHPQPHHRLTCIPAKPAVNSFQIFDHLGTSPLFFRRTLDHLWKTSWKSEPGTFHSTMQLWNALKRKKKKEDYGSLYIHLASRSHTHPSHSQTARLLTSSMSLGITVPRFT
jgi:hypothetical protein